MVDDIKIQFTLTANNQVQIAINGARKASINLNKQLKQNERAISKLGKAAGVFTRSLRGVARAATGLRSILAASVAAFAVQRIVSESIQLENSLIGLRSVAKATGQDINSITEAAKELSSDGIIPLSQVSASLKNLLATGLDAGESIKLFKALRDAAAFNRQGTLELGQAVEGATQGFKNQLSTLIDNAGVTKNLSVLQKEFAASIGTTIGNLTEAQKVQANYTGILREASIFQDNYNLLQNTFSGVLSKATGNIRFLLAELGNLITQNPIIIEQLKAFVGSLVDLRKSVKDNQKEIISFVNNGLKVFGDAISETIKFVQGLIVTLGLLGVAFLALSIGPVIASIGAFIASLNVLIVTLVAVQAATTVFAIALKATGIGLFIASVAFLSNKVGDLIDGLKGLKNPLQVLGVLFRTLKAEVFGSTEEVAALREELVQLLLESTKFKVIRPKLQIEETTAEVELSLGESFTNFLGDFFLNFDKGASKGLALFAKNLSGGFEGAVNVVKSLGESVIGALAPGFGEIGGELLGLLSKGPEEVTKIVDAFTSAFPKIFENIILSIPLLVERLIIGLTDAVQVIAERADIIVEGFVRGMIRAAPRIAIALALQMPRVGLALARSMPGVATAFVDAIVEEAPRFVDKIIEEITGFFNQIPGFDVGGGGIGGALGFLGGGGAVGGALGGAIGGFSGFQNGGKIVKVPSGFSNDTALARVSSGELIVSNDTTRLLESFLANPPTGNGNNSELSVLLSEIAGLLQRPVTVEGQITGMDNRAFANQMLTISRTNLRAS